MNNKYPVSPLAPDAFPKMPSIPGVRLATAASGSRYAGRDDLLIAEFDPDTAAAGVFTRSALPAAPVVWSGRALRNGSPRALVVNAGNANAFTGPSGHNAAKAIAAAAAQLAQCAPGNILLASTGVIGDPLDPQPITAALKRTWPLLDSQNESNTWIAAAKAISTTDTFPKVATQTAKIGKTSVTINGIAKGSGMIAPDMATMLAFAFTDAALPAPLLRALLKDALHDSFNAISVDGDTSTNDTLLLFATGKKPAPARRLSDPALKQFRQRLRALFQDLAFQIVRDGEGATKFITVRVSGAASKPAARRIALSVANSPLVKTAIAGQDANWGRIVMAIGKAGEKISQKHLTIKIGHHAVAKGGAPAPHDAARLAQYMQQPEISLHITAGNGSGDAAIHTCDLTHGYVSINADYRS